MIPHWKALVLLMGVAYFKFESRPLPHPLKLKQFCSRLVKLCSNMEKLCSSLEELCFSVEQLCCSLEQFCSFLEKLCSRSDSDRFVGKCYKIFSLIFYSIDLADQISIVL